jgi:hypothetical protein
MVNLRTQWRALLETTATLAVIALCVVLMWSTLRHQEPRALPQRPPSRPAVEVDPPRDPISIEGGAVQGDPTAKVALIAFSDFLCPYCGTFARETLPDNPREARSRRQSASGFSKILLLSQFNNPR